MRTNRPLSLFLSLATLVAAPVVAYSAWYPAGTAVCTAAGVQRYVHPVPDGAGGMLLVFEDQRGATGSDLYAHHLTANGVDAAWPVNGRALCTASGDQGKLTNQFAATSDGAGGAYATWCDPRGANDDIYVQHVLASGGIDPAWPANGLVVCNATGSQNNPAICADGSGGAIVAWHDARGAAADVYAQHVLATGAVDAAWPANGRLVCGATNAQYTPAILPDAAGGALIAWADYRSGTDYDVYAHRVLANGTLDPAWPADGRAVATGTMSQSSIQLTSDGGTGAIVTWEGFPASDGSDLWAHHLSRAGVLDAAWPAGGKQYCFGVHSQTQVSVVPDGSGGIYAAWMDMRNGTGATNADIYAHHIPSTGQPDWALGEVAVCNASGEQMSPQLVADPAGGVYVFWQDKRGGNVYEIYAQRLQSNGVVASGWPANGLAMCALGTSSYQPQAVADGAGGAVVAWYDYRTVANDADLYARRIGPAGVHRIDVSQTGTGTVQFEAPELTTVAFVDVTQHDAATFRFTPGVAWFLDAVTVNGFSVGAPPNVSFSGVTTAQQLSVSFSDATATSALTLNAGSYASFGVPLALSGTVDQQLAALGARSDPAWRLARWNPATSSYEFAGGALASLQPGEGYWLVSANSAALEFDGAPVPASTFGIPLAGSAASGWNQVSNPFRFEVADSALLVRVGGVGDVPFLGGANTFTDSVLWEWTGAGGYVVSRSLKPGRAYWVKKKADTGVTLLVPHRASTRSAAAPALPAGAAWAVALIARQGESRTTRVWAGVASAAEAAGHVIAAPPDAPGPGLSLALVGGEGTNVRDMQRLAMPDAAKLWVLALDVPATPGAVQLECEAFALPAGMRLWLSDEARGWTRELVPGESLELAAFAGTRRLTLRADTQASPEAPAPASASRVIAYPNPFRDTAGLVFALPRGGAMAVDIVDVAGRLVRRLESRAERAGEQVVTWDGRDTFGVPVAPGVYLARHRAGGTPGCVRLVKLP